MQTALQLFGERFFVFRLPENRLTDFQVASNIVTALSVHAAEGHFFVLVHFDGERVSAEIVGLFGGQIDAEIADGFVVKIHL